MNCRTIWALMGLLSFNVQAALSVQDSSFGADTLITDSTTGLTWLSLKPTLGLSYGQVYQQLGFGGEFAGFEIATGDQVMTMEKDAGVDTSLGTGDYSISNQVCPGCAQSGLVLGTLFGGQAAAAATHLGPNTGDYLAWGRVRGAPPAADGSSFETYIGFEGNSSGVAIEGDHVLQVLAGDPYPYAPEIGTWLETTLPPVPPVPEPSTYALVLTGLGVIAFVKRRRKN